MLKVIIADLDNTVYPVTSIGDRLFKPLIELMKKHDEIDNRQIQQIKEEMMKKPWQQVADKHHLPKEVIEQGTKILEQLTYDLPMTPYEDYKYLLGVKAEKFLVTMGFTKLQHSKVQQLNIGDHFKEVIVVDPQTTGKTKQDIFIELMERYNLRPDEVLAVGDDPDSEIKAAKALGISTYLFDEKGLYPPDTADYQFNTLAHLTELFAQM